MNPLSNLPSGSKGNRDDPMDIFEETRGDPVDANEVRQTSQQTKTTALCPCLQHLTASNNPNPISNGVHSATTVGLTAAGMMLNANGASQAARIRAGERPSDESDDVRTTTAAVAMLGIEVSKNIKGAEEKDRIRRAANSFSADDAQHTHEEPVLVRKPALLHEPGRQFPPLTPEEIEAERAREKRAKFNQNKVTKRVARIPANVRMRNAREGAPFEQAEGSEEEDRGRKRKGD